jgi:hypothetical protein
MVINLSSPSLKRKAVSNFKGGNRKCACWNCGGEDHFHHDCKQPLKDKKAGVSGSANVAADSDDEEDGVFGVSDANSLPDLQSVSNTLSESSGEDSMPGLKTILSLSDGETSDVVLL